MNATGCEFGYRWEMEGEHVCTNPSGLCQPEDCANESSMNSSGCTLARRLGFWENLLPVACGRPYTVQGEYLKANLKSTASGALGEPGAPARSWGSNHADLGGRWTYTPLEAQGRTRAGRGDTVARELMAEALRLAGVASNPFPQLQGTLQIEPQLDEVIAAAHAHVAATNEQLKWHNSGLQEHASVGSFAKLCLELLVAGAPPDLLRRAISAQEEELLHAHIALALGGGAQNGGSQLEFPGHTLDLHHNPNAMRAAAIKEGLGGEGHAAMELFQQALDALGGEDPLPMGRQAFAKLAWAMACDEARHAALALEVVDWLQNDAAQGSLEVRVRSGAVHVREL